MNGRTADPASAGWHLDRRVPVSIIFVLIIQFAGGVWVASSMQSEIERGRENISRIDRQVEIMRDAGQVRAIQLGRIEENTSALKKDLQRLVNIIDQNGWEK